ncbi:MAG: hypothetical protein ACLT1A_12110 [Dysosmobacter sp.]
MGQEVLDAFWKSNDRDPTMKNTLLYHRLARACGLPDCALLAAVHPAVGGGALTQTRLSEQRCPYPSRR